MEERVPPASYNKPDLGKPPTSPPPRPPPPFPGHGIHETEDALRSGTYVVQVPKDQIYRVPPPENAAYLERQRKNPTPQKKRSMCSCILFPILILFILALILLLIVGITYFIVQPKKVNFSIQSLLTGNSHKNPEFDVTLKAENPNGQMGVNCLKGGDASLSFKQNKISTGNPPAFSTEAKTSTRVRLVLSGLKGKLPSQLQKSMQGKGKKKESIALSLLVNIPVKMEIGVLTSWSMNMAVTCDLTVNTLAKGTRVLSQKCQTKIQVFS
ncbi:NDR1/HIN1-like protein 13 [Macadamia integrifolia]|uniref:NDR1/HIN1-like protein 13 n=1 Tax=Macadamia integrifolia TaxID=60698 RepID=UPI001C4F2878|nr:NDR1/HIN1-like protein 13 [Macadamia integrifolia]